MSFYSYVDCECGMVRIPSDIDMCGACEVAYREGARAASAEEERDRLRAENTELRKALIGTAANLAAAVSLLERGSKQGAASDRMFKQMLRDFNKAIGTARAALAGEEPTP